MKTNIKYYIIGCFTFLTTAAFAQQSATSGAKKIAPEVHFAKYNSASPSITAGAKRISPTPDNTIRENKGSITGEAMKKNSVPVKSENRTQQNPTSVKENKVPQK